MDRRFDAYVFDLDGTLLDTLPDLATATNLALERFGLPTHSTDAIRRMVGHGLRSLISQAVPQDLPAEQVEEVLAAWKVLYDEHGHEKTRVYDGMLETLAELRDRGCKIGVLSNKFDAGVQMVVQRYLADYVDFALGEGPVPRKPDPQGLLAVAEMFHVKHSRICYVGDSDTDVETAHRAGAFAVAAAWGYQPREQMAAARPDAWAEVPTDLLAL